MSRPMRGAGIETSILVVSFGSTKSQHSAGFFVFPDIDFRGFWSYHSVIHNTNIV